MPTPRQGLFDPFNCRDYFVQPPFRLRLASNIRNKLLSSTNRVEPAILAPTSLMICQPSFAEQLGDKPMRGGAAGLRQAQICMRLLCPPAGTDINGIISIPFSVTFPCFDCVRVLARREPGLITAWLTADGLNLFNLEITKNPVMRVVATLVGE